MQLPHADYFDGNVLRVVSSCATNVDPLFPAQSGFSIQIQSGSYDTSQGDRGRRASNSAASRSPAGLPVKVVVFNNGTLGFIELEQATISLRARIWNLRTSITFEDAWRGAAMFTGMGTDNQGKRIALGTPTTAYGLMLGEYWAGRTPQRGAFAHI